MVIHTKRLILTDFKIGGRRWPSVAVGGRRWPSVAVGGRRWPSVGFIVWCELGFRLNNMQYDLTGWIALDCGDCVASLGPGFIQTG